jgi:PHD/YefM family antitoxin component YafN of YafNO toxin-antitoxin module
MDHGIDLLRAERSDGRHGSAVLVSAEDFSALSRGAYLLRSPANAPPSSHGIGERSDRYHY